LGSKVPVWLLLAAVGDLKFGFGALRFGLLFETLATTYGNSGWLFAVNIFDLMLQNHCRFN